MTENNHYIDELAALIIRQVAIEADITRLNERLMGHQAGELTQAIHEKREELRQIKFNKIAVRRQHLRALMERRSRLESSSLTTTDPHLAQEISDLRSELEARILQLQSIIDHEQNT
jgi:hypothetical protein